MPHNVAVVEDEELIQTMISINLQQAGFQVACFAAAEPLLEYLREGRDRCDIILLDIMLPGMTGEEAIPLIRQLSARTPILMLTAKRDLGTRVSTLNDGADDFLAKPFNVEELIARVNALLRRAQPAADEPQGV